MITNILPLPVLSTIVAHFDPNLDELRFNHNCVNIMISSNTVTALPKGAWIMEAVHISGADVVITADSEHVISVEEVCPHCANTGWINHGYARGMICACQGDNIPEG